MAKGGYALVTGASGGIGYEFAKILASEGNNLVLTARSKAKLLEIKSLLEAEYPVKVRVLEKDLSLPGSPFEIYQEMKSENIDIEILINNAGFADCGFFLDRDWSKEEQMINLNIIALTHMTKLFARDMVKRNYGRILNVASTAGFLPGPMMAVYYATKAYVLSFSEAIACELKNTGVSLTTLCPGPTETGFATAAEATGTKLFTLLKVAQSRKVAEYGYKAMMRGRRLAIHGVLYRMMVFFLRIIPRSWVLPVAKKLNQ